LLVDLSCVSVGRLLVGVPRAYSWGPFGKVDRLSQPHEPGWCPTGQAYRVQKMFLANFAPYGAGWAENMFSGLNDLLRLPSTWASAELPLPPPSPFIASVRRTHDRRRRCRGRTAAVSRSPHGRKGPHFPNPKSSFNHPQIIL
jgi:hypothetical protein